MAFQKTGKASSLGVVEQPTPKPEDKPDTKPEEKPKDRTQK